MQEKTLGIDKVIDDTLASHLGTVAATCAQWLRDNPENKDQDDEGMEILCTAYLTLFHELYERGIIKPGYRN